MFKSTTHQIMSRKNSHTVKKKCTGYVVLQEKLSVPNSGWQVENVLKAGWGNDSADKALTLRVGGCQLR